MATNVVKSYNAFRVNEGLLLKVLEAVKKGEVDARRYSQVRSFEVSYHGHRQDLILGTIYIVPAKLADDAEAFPAALLYGAIVKEISPETMGDLFHQKIGDSEFDSYNDVDMRAIKDKLFKDAEGRYRSLVAFIPAWGNPRDLVTFKYVRNDETLLTLLRHQIYSVYYDPKLSNTFDHLSGDIATGKTDVMDITPKFPFPYLAENELKDYPTFANDLLDKTAGEKRAKVLLTAKNADAVSEEFLEKGEKAVLNALAEKLGEKIDGVEEPGDAAKQAAEATGVSATGLRNRPDYGEPGSYTTESNDAAIAETKSERKQGTAKKADSLSEVVSIDPIADPAAPVVDPMADPLADPMADPMLGDAMGAPLDPMLAAPMPGESEVWADRELGLIKEVSQKTNPEASTWSEEGTREEIRKAIDIIDTVRGSDALSNQGQEAQDILTPPPVAPVDDAAVVEAPAAMDPVDPNFAEEMPADQPDDAATATDEAAPVEEEPAATPVTASKRRVLAKDHALLLEVKKAGKSTMVAVSPAGHVERVALKKGKVAFAQPALFPASFRSAVTAFMVEASKPKKANVPLTEEAIFAEITQEIGPAPQADIKLPQDAAPAAAPAAPAQAKGESGSGVSTPKPVSAPVEKAESGETPKKTRSGEDENGKPNRLDEFKTGTSKAEHCHGSLCRTTRETHCACRCAKCKPYDAKSEAKDTKSEGKEKTAAGPLGLKVDKPIQHPHEFYPYDGHSDALAGPGDMEMRCRVCNKKYGEGNHKTAAYNLFVPGQVLDEFYPELMHEEVSYPNDPHADLNPLELDRALDAQPEGKYISTDPAGALMGFGGGKQQVLDGIPLRQENDIRGYGFNDEFYSQYEGVDPKAFVASTDVLKRVRKKASPEDFPKQFSEFLKRAIGEVAASFIAAFKATQRPLLSKVPGTGSIQFDQVESANLLAYIGNQVDQASRLRFLVGKLTDSQIQDAINDAWAQAAVWNSTEEGGYTYEVFVRAEALDQDSLVLKYSFVCGTKGL